MDKLTYTAVLELVPLMQIPGVKKVGVMVLSFWFTTIFPKFGPKYHCHIPLLTILAKVL